MFICCGSSVITFPVGLVQIYPSLFNLVELFKRGFFKDQQSESSFPVPIKSCLEFRGVVFTPPKTTKMILPTLLNID